VPLPEYLRDKKKEQILELIAGGVEPGSILHGQYQTALAVRAIEDLVYRGCGISLTGLTFRQLLGTAAARI
jgi:hypothetical protein